MTPKEIEDLKATLTETIKITVNGKIDRLNNKLDLYIQEDNDWKDRAKPVIEMGNNARGASVAALWLAGLIIAIGGAWEIIRNLVTKK